MENPVTLGQDIFHGDKDKADLLDPEAFFASDDSMEDQRMAA